jgi:hypothetical protein
VEVDINDKMTEEEDKTKKQKKTPKAVIETERNGISWQGISIATSLRLSSLPSATAQHCH